MDSYVKLLIDKLVNSGVEEKTADRGFKMAVEDLKNNKMSDNIAKLNIFIYSVLNSDLKIKG